MRQVVIVGGGIAGIVTATHLARRLKRADRVAVTLIDHNFAHAWKPMLHTFAAGTANSTIQKISFGPHAKRNGFSFWPGRLAGLDRGRKTVVLGPVTLPDGHSELPGRSISYDTLILAIGNCCDDFHTPGVTEHCFFIDDLGQALIFNGALRSKIIQSLGTNSETGVVIVGGGATGVELAAELIRSMETFVVYAPYKVLPRLRIMLVETAPRLLAGFSERISQAVEDKLRRLGIDVRTGARVVGADEHGLSLQGGERIDAALRVWAAGVKAPPVTAHLDGLLLNRKGQISIRPTLQTTQDENIFALGDCSSCEGSEGKVLPPTAQVARQQAMFLARSLANHLRREKALREFSYRDMGSLITLGDYAAYGSLGHNGFLRGAPLRGWLAKQAHASIYRMHQLDTNGFLNGSVGWLADSLMRLSRPAIGLD